MNSVQATANKNEQHSSVEIGSEFTLHCFRTEKTKPYRIRLNLKKIPPEAECVRERARLWDREKQNILMYCVMFIRIVWWVIDGITDRDKKSDTFFHRLSLSASVSALFLGVCIVKYSRIYIIDDDRIDCLWLCENNAPIPVCVCAVCALSVRDDILPSRSYFFSFASTHRELIGGPTATITISDALNFRMNKTHT